MVEKRNAENNQGREQCRTRGEPVQTINQVEGVGNANDPQNREWKPNSPAELLGTEQHGQAKNPETSSKEHRASNALYGELNVRTDGIDVVTEAQQENQCRRYNQDQECSKWSVQTEGRKISIGQKRNRNTHQEAEVYGDAAHARQRDLMEVTLLKRGRHPPTAHGEVAHEPGEKKREADRRSENDQIERRQRTLHS